MTRPGPERPFRAGNVICCDLDGVVWRGEQPIPGSAAAIARARGAGFRVAFLTNNSSGRVADYVDKLAAVGVEAEPDDVLTSAQAAAGHLSVLLPRGGTVLACAGPGVVEAVTQAGFDIVDAAPADAVVVGFHREFDFERLRRAADAIRAGARFVATNADPTYPVPGGLVPGAGALVAAVATASGATPDIAGKPEPPTVALVRDRLGDEGIVIGDRPSTDGVLAIALGWPFGLVLSGVAGAPGEEPIPDPPPPFIAADLAQLVPLLLRG